jgi:hypothetical protein
MSRHAAFHEHLLQARRGHQNERPCPTVQHLEAVRDLAGTEHELARAARELGVPATEADLPIEDVERFVLPVVDVEWSRHFRH